MPPDASATAVTQPAGAARTRLAIRLAGLGALAVLYFAAGKLGLALAFVHTSASAVWPPAGIAVGALLAFGPRVWPAVAVGAFFVNLTTTGDVPSSLAIAGGNTLEAVTAWWLVTRWAAGRAAFEQPASAVRFMVLAGAVAPVVAATTGVLALVVGGLAPAADWLSIAFTWWLGDAVGILVVAPPIAVWRRPARNGARAGAWETAAAALVIAALGWLAFGNSPAGVRRYPLEFLPAAALVWPAVRLGAREATLLTLLLSAVAVTGTLRGFGPFSPSPPAESLLLLQTFVGSVAIIVLAVAAEVAARQTAEAEVIALNESLEQRVAARTDELERLGDRLGEAQALAHIGSWEWQVASDSVWWSDELYRIYGVAPGVPITYSAFMTGVHPDDRTHVGDTVGRALADGQPFRFEHRIVRPDGRERVLLARGQVVIDAAGQPQRMFGTAHDITEQKIAERERAQLVQEQAARREAEAANRAKDEFLAVLSHELRTPLNAAVGWTHMLRDGPADDALRARAVDAVLRNLDAQTRLVADMLDASHITLGTLRLDRARVDLAVVARDAVEMLRPSAAARGIALEARIPAGPLTIEADAGRLQQVIGNVATNAVKFTPDGGHVSLEVTDDTTAFYIRIADSGPGIPPDFWPHLFQRFKQADLSARRTHGGLGLGLALAHHLVEAHGGTITAANGDRGGAVFTITLPRSAA